MIEVICDGCKQPITRPRAKIHTKDFQQVIGDDGNVEADLCKECYKKWCDGLDAIDKKFSKLSDDAEKDFKKKFLT